MNFPIPIENNEATTGVSGTGLIQSMYVFEDVPQRVTNVIKGGGTGSNWGVHLEWEIDGPAAAATTLSLDSWAVQLFLESIGPGAEFVLPAAGPEVVTYTSGILTSTTPAASRKWSHDISITAAASPVAAGLYKLGATLQLWTPPIPGGTAHAMVGFVEGAIVQFYD